MVKWSNRSIPYDIRKKMIYAEWRRQGGVGSPTLEFVTTGKRKRERTFF